MVASQTAPPVPGNSNTNGKVNGTVKDGSTESQKLVKKLYAVANERGGTSWLDECPDYLQTNSGHQDHALVTRYKEDKAVNAKQKVVLSSIDVQSPYLKDVIRQIFKNYPGAEVDEAQISFSAPFHSLFHQWPMLQAAYGQSKTQQHEGYTEIEALLNILEEEFGASMRDAQNLAANGNTTFALAWTLFPPGEPVFADYKKRRHCLLVHEVKYLMNETIPLLSIEALFLDHDGERFGWRRMKQFVEAFGGSRPIRDLAIVPLHLHDDPATALKTLHMRGSMATDLAGASPVYKAYEGALRLHSPWLDMEEVEVFVEGRCIIDAKMHAQQASRYCPSVSTKPHRLECLLSRDEHTKIVNMAENTILPMSDNLNAHPVLRVGKTKLIAKTTTDTNGKSPLKHHRWTEALVGISTEAFCRSVSRGYCLFSKSWAEFEIDCMRDVRWNKNAFDALVIPPARKRLLEALVRQQQKRKADEDLDDVVSGKGQGLIMLLAGPPGTGKTLTAESIADKLHLPLYAVSAGELGDTDKEIEAQFGQILRLAASWDAVLLLDEADAFLEKRIDAPEARHRNKRVAAFLRILEYYRGILILTTNRSVNFDDAFYSRIHLSLTFKPLTQESREDIWKTFLRGATISQSDLTSFASQQLNGRQIKNCMKMARLLATDEDVPLSANHIRDVLDVATEDLEISADSTQ